MTNGRSRGRRAATKRAKPIRAARTVRASAGRRTLDARPDTLDFRDRMFVPSLIEVPLRRPLDDYRLARVPILDQGQEGACTGFGLATVAHYLLRVRRVDPDTRQVSPRMFYDMARRYDEWPGESYEGSSARGAMKGWHKHGVCSAENWVYSGRQNSKLYTQRFAEALRRPLGAYFRVNHKDIVAMHSAISEVGVLYATASVHEGWQHVRKDGIIRYTPDITMLGGHAFAIVAYDERGFWIQNSWGDDWGYKGFGLVSYDDWLANGSDVWVARLGAPIVLRDVESTSKAVGVASQGSRSYTFCDLRPHIVSLGNNGVLRTDGTFGTSEKDVKEIFEHVGEHPAGRKNLLLYAHGGLTAEDSAIQKVADLRPPLLEAGVYPISLIWKTDLWSTFKNMLRDAVARRRPEGFLDSTKDFMLDRLDDALEPLARAIGGKQQWDEMKENATLAASPKGGLVVLAEEIASLKASNPSLRIHLVGHSAGSILLGGLIERLTGGRGKSRVAVATCTLWAPACTMDLYRAQYLPALEDDLIGNLALFTLTDRAERDDNCVEIYHKSLLYLVSNAFEKRLRKPLFGSSDGEPLLGMEKFVRALPAREQPKDWVLSPNTKPMGDRGASQSVSHAGFDDDLATLRATLERVVGKVGASARFERHRSETANRMRRAALSAQPAAASL